MKTIKHSWIQGFIIFLLSATNLFGATFTTTATVGTWDIPGAPTGTDDIIVNHDWSSYAGVGTMVNSTGSLTINAGGYLKVTGDMATWYGYDIIIAAGGTLHITGSFTLSAQHVVGWGNNSMNNLGTLIVGGAMSNFFCDKCTWCADQPSCNADPTCKWTNYGSVSVSGAYSGNGECGSSILPVELTYFGTKKIGEDQVQISWSTASEINNSYFSVERSLDGISFQSIGIVKGAGTTSEKTDYSYVDDIGFIQTSTHVYYRLKQVDFDLQYDYSVISVVSNAGENKIFYNSGQKSFDVTVFSSGKYLLQLFDFSGKLLSQSTESLSAGNVFSVPISASGAVIFSVTDEEGIRAVLRTIAQ